MFSMSCRIEFPAGEPRGLSPNFGYLIDLLRAQIPEDLSGTVSVSVSASGVGLEFTGARAWSGISVDAEIIPRWMFGEIAFRELISNRLRRFVDLLEQLQPCHPDEEDNDFRWSGEWALG